jgi:thioredoxin 1
MMVERLVITVILAAVAVSAYAVVRQWQVRRVQGNHESGGEASLLYFWSDHCAPCVTQSRVLQQLPAQVVQRIQIRQINAEKESEIAARYGVFTLPTTMLLDREGSVRHVNYGLADAGKLAQQVESVI